MSLFFKSGKQDYHFSTASNPDVINMPIVGIAHHEKCITSHSFLSRQRLTSQTMARWRSLSIARLLWTSWFPGEYAGKIPDRVCNLLDSWITERDNYDRNHGPILHKLAAEYDLTVDGLVSRPMKLTLEDLNNRIPQHRVTCALLCAGNRRHTMRTRIKEVWGVDWFDGAIMNCTWEGPLLRDVLHYVGVAEVDDEEKKRHKHVQFASYGSETQEDQWYGGSIPFERAMDPKMDVILATKVRLSARTFAVTPS